MSALPITITLEGGVNLHEFSSFWVKAVRGFDPRLQGGRCLRGPFLRVNGARVPPMHLPTPYVLPPAAKALYVFGRSSHGAANDFHVALVPEPGSRVELPLTKATDEKRRDVERLRRLLQEQTWIVAATMPENPHEYTRRQDWASETDFVWAVEHIRRLGYRQRYANYFETVFAAGAHFHWTGWWPAERTPWFNRKPLAEAAPVVESLVDQTFIAENARLLDIPELPDGFAGLDASITRCRHFQAGVHLFGYVAPDVDLRPRLRKRDHGALGPLASARVEQKGVLKPTQDR